MRKKLSRKKIKQHFDEKGKSVNLASLKGSYILN